MTIANIAKACQGVIHGEITKEIEARGVVIDSRKIEQDFVFIATKGERVDGHKFIPQVFQQGALAVICEQLPEVITGICIVVEDSFQALKDVAEFYRNQLDIKVVGVTGSVGKTSTKGFIASVLEQKFKVHKTEGNFNNEVGLPLTVLQIREEHEIAVLEMGINHFGEMRRLSKIAKPDICVITNIGACHLEHLRDLDGVLEAKSEIFEFMKEDGFVCINGDDEKLKTLPSIYGKKPIQFGFLVNQQEGAMPEEGYLIASERKEVEPKHSMVAKDVINKGLFGSEAKICIKEDTFEGECLDFSVTVPLPGEHMIYNALAATAVGSILGVSKEQIAAGIQAVPSVAGRSNIIKLQNKVVIDDCYNANPVSMKAAIDLLNTANTRTVAVLGDMFELGEEEWKLHGQVGDYVKEQEIDVLIAIGTMAEELYKKAMGGVTETYYFQTKEEFLERCQEILQLEDTILLKASHGMHFEEILQQWQ